MIKRPLATLIACTLVIACQPLDKAHTIDKAPNGQLLWDDCQTKDWFSDEQPDKLQCATLDVPLDSTQPKKGTLSLALTRLPATGERIGNLLIIAGGPGDTSLNSVQESFGDNDTIHRIRKHFDIIGFAPRGVAPSTPALDCGAMADDDNAEAFVKGCITHSGKLLPYISTKDATLDIERIRQALGEEQISLLGYSYGTKVLAYYVSQFPKAVRAAVFDGVVDTTEDFFTALAGQQRGFEETFRRFASYCTDFVACPFENADSYQEGFWQFLNDIDRQTLKDSQGNVISAEDVLSIIQDNLMWQDDWENIIALMEDLQAGSTDIYNELSPASDDDNPLADLGLIAINCADGTPTDKNDYLEQAKAVDALSSYDNYRPKDDSDYLDACYYWPHTGTDLITLPVLNEPLPLLFVAQKYDPTTPYRNAVMMAKHFDAPLITRDGDGHTLVFTGESQCVDNQAAAHLLAPNQAQKSRVCP